MRKFLSVIGQPPRSSFSFSTRHRMRINLIKSLSYSHYNYNILNIRVKVPDWNNHNDNYYKSQLFYSTVTSTYTSTSTPNTIHNSSLKIEKNSNLFRISGEIREALENEKAVVALESAILTNGMPYPDNISTALNLQKIIRDQGCFPATVGMIKGQLVVGLSESEIEKLGDPSNKNVVKVSRRDFPYAFSQRLDGGTTVSGTIIACSKAKIPIFVTGGLGGVHRGASETFDISADLKELGRNEICVISSGIKSILDIEKTLEYLETEGVCVCVLKSAEEGDSKLKNKITQSQPELEIGSFDKKAAQVKFPSFFTRESNFFSPYFVKNEIQAANLVHSTFSFALGSGILLAVPIPKEFEASGERIEKAIKLAEEMAIREGIKGRDVTPYLLSQINSLTHGESLEANKRLIENNATIGSQIALELSNLRQNAIYDPQPRGSGSSGGINFGRRVEILDKKGKDQVDTSLPLTLTKANPIQLLKSNFLAKCSENRRGNFGEIVNEKKRNPHDVSSTARRVKGRPVVVGGSSYDLIMTLQEKEIVEDGRTHRISMKSTPGGVGRNIAEALGKLGQSPILISAIGVDLFGSKIMDCFHKDNMDCSGFLKSSSSTAIYAGILNEKGECLYGLGAMDIHDQISPEFVLSHSNVISEAPILVMDANIQVDAMETVLEICCEHNVPVWFEPTEIRKCTKILKTSKELWKCIQYISPNLKELISLLPATKTKGKYEFDKKLNHTQFNDYLSPISPEIFEQFANLQLLLLTRGSNGFTLVTKDDSIKMINYSAPSIDSRKILSVSGAGDCLNAGFIYGILNNLSLEDCSDFAIKCAKESLLCIENVPEKFIHL